ncbi:MAG: precorrin-6Y C5,15-methyltransferase (decarboxylating) subunit CbiT [Thermoproteota archaeon]|nr:precorrin-6Y C5,15-methyltransferase (decarboxylating) subunit CbiT [Thermoproteota archaeon]
MRLWDYCTPGISDELFDRIEEVPITKEDIRAIVISKLRLREGYSAIDVGCGSGSITVELCLQTKGKVYAVDFNERAVEITKKNLQKFGVRAEEVILGKAQEVLPKMSQVEAIVVGGTWGDAKQVIDLSVDRLKKGGRIVIDTILIETMYQALAAINELKLNEIDVTQVVISKSRRVTTGTMMLARNPVMIISATKA